MNFVHTLRRRWHAADSMLCVGLDPDPSSLPPHLGGGLDAIERFCRDIVAATADAVCAFKPQIAYFAAQGAEDVLARLIAHIHTTYPGIPVILDAKRGDIGSTARQYGIEAFERFGADALTLSPFMGFDSIEPYFDWSDRGLILLCRTSNPGGNDLQALPIQTDPDDVTMPHAECLYERIARLAADPWNRHGQLGLVVGATYPEELARVRALAPKLPLLVPGVGAQGGDVDATVRAGLDAEGYGLIINSSRAILYAGRDVDYAHQARTAALATRDAIRAARQALRP